MFPRVALINLTDEHADAVAAVLAHRGYPVAEGPADADVALVADGALPDGLGTAVSAGLGLVTLGAAGAALLSSTGITAAEATAPVAGVVGVREETATVCTEDLLARVDLDAILPTTTFTLTASAVAVLRRPGSTRNPGDPVAALGRLGSGRVVALGTEALDPATGDLLVNALTYAARPSNGGVAHAAADVVTHPAWLRLKRAVVDLQALQAKDGSLAEGADASAARGLVSTVTAAITELAPSFDHDADYLAALVKDFTRWSDGGFEIPDFLDSLLAFHPEQHRVDGLQHLVVFPMYTQNGSPDRLVEAVLLEVIWPDFIADLEAGDYSNKLFLPIRFLDFTPGYDTNSAVLFPETIAMREIPKFTWGAIFADREAARFRRVVTQAAETTGLALPPDAARLLADQRLAEQTFVMWDLIHDRTHMHGDLPFDPFMIKQRMPFFLYSLEELRCDLTAFRESVTLEAAGVPHARLVQYAVIFDRIFRFAITGTRVRNYDGLGGQLLFAWLHQHHVLHWTDNRLSIDWDRVTGPVLELGRQIEELYWRSIDRPKSSHWLAAYQLVSATVEPHPASVWAEGKQALPLDGPPKGLTDAVLPDEFPLSMFYEALKKKLTGVVESTAGITG